VLATAAGVLARRPRFRPKASFVAGFVVVLAIVVTPYTVRNWRVMGAPFFIRDNFGLELAVSNADNARLTADANLDAGAAMDTHPFVSPQAALRVRAEGEVAYNRRRLREATAWIRTHPARFLEFVTERAGLLLVPWSRRAHQRLAVALISLGFLLGLVTLWRGGRRIAAAVLGGAVIGYDAIYLLVQHDMRYVYPMLRLQSLVAAAACVAIAVRAVRGDSMGEDETESSIAQQPIAV